MSTSASPTRRLDPTFLLADVEIVATYMLLSTSTGSGWKTCFHRVFAAARLDMEIKDRFGNPVKPREWFLVAAARDRRGRAERIKDGTIVAYEYDPATASLVKAERS